MSNIPSSKVPEQIHIGHGLLKPKILFVSDLDGTLLNPQTRITASSAEMLNRAIAGGALFTIATARTPGTVVDLMKEVDMQLPGVVMTGAALFNFETHEFSRICCLKPETVEQMLQLYRHHGVSTFIYIINEQHLLDCYHIGSLNKFEREFIELRCNSPFKTFHVPETGESVLPESFRNTVLLFSVQPWEKAHKLWQEIKDNPNLPCYPLCYHDAFGPEWGELEMFSPQTSKAAAVEAIASDTGASRIIAFGDNVNDITLFELADEGIAVDNAIDELKEIASEVIGSNSENSVAQYILRRLK